MPYEHLTCVNDARLAPYARVRDADLAAWPDAPAGLFMAESRAVIAAAIEAGVRPRSFLVSESWADDAAPLARKLLAQHPDCPALCVLRADCRRKLAGSRAHGAGFHYGFVFGAAGV